MSSDKKEATERNELKDNSEQTECPRCGREISNIRWAPHFRNCGGDEDV